MTFENGVAILKIVEVFPEDIGLYELVARNEKGETKTVANLSVKGGFNSVLKVVNAWIN